MSDKRRLTGLTQHVDAHSRTAGQKVLMTEQAQTCALELGFHVGLAGQRSGRSALCIRAPAFEMSIDPYRHNHRIATDPMELLKHGQTMLGAGEVLKQLHAKNAVNRIRRQADGER